MLKKLATMVLLVLVALPCTAPFQTYDPAPDGLEAVLDHSVAPVARLTAGTERPDEVLHAAVARPAVVKVDSRVSSILSTRFLEPSQGGPGPSVLRL